MEMARRENEGKEEDGLFPPLLDDVYTYSFSIAKHRRRRRRNTEMRRFGFNARREHLKL